MRYVPFDIAWKLLVSLGIGLLVGFEREWAHKDVGVRTFAIVSLLGLLTTLGSPVFAWIGMAAVVVLVAIMNVGNLARGRELETTTSFALIVTFMLGVLVGEGHVFTPTAAAIGMTLLLSLKPQFTKFAGGVTAQEIRGAVVLGLIGFVIYPVLPDRAVDPWDLFNPREAWLTVILISGIGFINYVLLRVYSQRGLYYAAVFGGLVNSTAAVAELTTSVAGEARGSRRCVVAVTQLTVVAMFVRNLAVLTAFSPAAGFVALWPIAAMSLFTGVYAYSQRAGGEAAVVSRQSSPVSLRNTTSFGLVLVAIQVIGTLAQRTLGEAGGLVVSFLGGLVSSASATAVAGSLAGHHQMTPRAAAIATVLACIASATVNVPVIFRRGRQTGAVSQLLGVAAVTTAIGLGVLALVLRFGA